MTIPPEGSLDLIPLDVDTVSPEHLESAIPVRSRDPRKRIEVSDIDRGSE